MTLGALLGLWRKRIDDLETPYLWSDLEGVVFANAAVNEACERALLLQQDDHDSALCNIDGTALDAVYPLDPRILEVRSVTWKDMFLTPISRETLNDERSITDATVYGAYFQWPPWDGRRDWSTLTGTPRYFLAEQGKSLTLIRKPTVAEAIHLSVYRYPLTPLSLSAQDEEPELPERYHLHLLDWMEHLSFDNIDADKGDPERSAKKAASFAGNFGERPDANVQRKRRENRSHQVRMNPSW